MKCRIFVIVGDIFSRSFTLKQKKYFNFLKATFYALPQHAGQLYVTVYLCNCIKTLEFIFHFDVDNTDHLDSNVLIFFTGN